MTICPVHENTAEAQTTGSQATPYDSIWAGGEVPVQQPTGLESIMLAEDKLYVVLAVVLIIWIGLTLFILSTDRRIERLERKVDEGIPEKSQGTQDLRIHS